MGQDQNNWAMRNKERVAAIKKAWKAANPEKVAQYRKTFNKKNPGRSAELSKESHHRRFAADPESMRLAWKKGYDKEKAIERSKAWKARNPDRMAELSAQRKARKINATPAWANKFFITEAYHLAKLRTQMTGFKWEVDHIVPLNSDVVCGFHVEHNLQVIPAVVNNKKGNKMIEVRI